MPQVSADVHVPIPPDLAFAVSQTTGAVRRRWDPFIREQRFLDGAREPGVGVRTFTRTSFLGPLSPSMVGEYVVRTLNAVSVVRTYHVARRVSS